MSDDYRLEVIAQEPAPGQARVRLPEGADVHPAERDHAIDVIMRELGAESRTAEPETVIGMATFNGGTFVDFERTNPTDDRPSSLAEYATDGGFTCGDDLRNDGGQVDRCRECGAELGAGYLCDGCDTVEGWDDA